MISSGTISDIIFMLIGAVLSTLIPIFLEIWKARGRRQLLGEWWTAVQPVYYESKEWHLQKVNVKRSLLWGLTMTTVQEEKKLQWEFSAKLIDKSFLVGKWKSLRSGSTSNGFMTLQIASNGVFMCGHDYGKLKSNKKAHFGILLLGRTEAELLKAWEAMENGHRKMLSLDKAIDFY